MLSNSCNWSVTLDISKKCIVRSKIIIIIKGLLVAQFLLYTEVSLELSLCFLHRGHRLLQVSTMHHYRDFVAGRNHFLHFTPDVFCWPQIRSLYCPRQHIDLFIFQRTVHILICTLGHCSGAK